LLLFEREPGQNISFLSGLLLLWRVLDLGRRVPTQNPCTAPFSFHVRNFSTELAIFFYFPLLVRHTEDENSFLFTLCALQQDLPLFANLATFPQRGGQVFPTPLSLSTFSSRMWVSCFFFCGNCYSPPALFPMEDPQWGLTQIPPPFFPFTNPRNLLIAQLPPHILYITPDSRQRMFIFSRLRFLFPPPSQR